MDHGSNNVPELTQAALDYQRIAKAIAYLSDRALDQPDLTTVARAAHMSEFHFQRVFTRWAGISPKRFVQFLTVEHAKRQLLDSKPVLETALDSGLSSSGRLHDLFVSAEAATPGEFKSRGEGMRIDFGFHPSPFGPCLLGVTTRGVCWLSFLDGDDQRTAVRELKSHWSGARLHENPDATRSVAAQIFCGFKSKPNQSLSVVLLGTNFQIKVWRALLTIPTGAVTTYEQIGALVGAPRSARAIGAAVGRNAIAYLIPCHRVIRKTGTLGGYRWNEDRKRTMLGWEAAQKSGAPVLPTRR